MEPQGRVSGQQVDTATEKQNTRSSTNDPKLLTEMNIDRYFHMAEGEGEWSYSKNSRRQVNILSLFLECTTFFMYVYCLYMLHVQIRK